MKLHTRTRARARAVWLCRLCRCTKPLFMRVVGGTTFGPTFSACDDRAPARTAQPSLEVTEVDAQLTDGVRVRTGLDHRPPRLYG